MKPALEVSDLKAAYDRAQVVHGVSLEVATGEIVCLLGRNGAGKSTLLKAIAGVMKPTAGNVRLLGSEVGGRAAFQIAREGMAWVPQNNSLFPGLTVREHLDLVAKPNGAGDPLERAAEIFPVLGERGSQIAMTLSGGERKMLNIAQCVLREAKVIMLDEPTEGVAPQVTDELCIALQRIQPHCAILLVEQNLDTALKIGGRAYVLERGSIVETGEVSELHDAGVLHKRLSV